MSRSARVLISIIGITVILIGILLAAAIYTGAQRGVADVRSGKVQNMTNLRSLPSAVPAPISAAVTTDDDPFFGPADARVTVVEFGDFECPYCRQVYPTFRTLMLKYGDRVRFIWRDFPISDVHKYAQKAAEAGECAQEQNPASFWTLHDKIFANQARITPSDLIRYAVESGLDVAQFAACVDSGKYREEVELDFRAGIAAGVRGTPTFFVNGEKVAGVIPLDQFEAIIERALAATTSSTP